MNFTRSLPLIGEDGLARLAACRVTVVGLGGVGGYVVEVLARSGVGALTLIDGDKVEESNLNRQIAALCKDIGRYKAQVLAERVEQINAHCKVDAVCEMLTESNCAALVDGSSYVADAIDSLAAKAALAVYRGHLQDRLRPPRQKVPQDDEGARRAQTRRLLHPNASRPNGRNGREHAVRACRLRRPHGRVHRRAIARVRLICGDLAVFLFVESYGICFPIPTNVVYTMFVGMFILATIYAIPIMNV